MFFGVRIVLLAEDFAGARCSSAVSGGTAKIVQLVRAAIFGRLVRLSKNIIWRVRLAGLWLIWDW